MIPVPRPALSDGTVSLRLWGRPGDPDALAGAWADPEIVSWARVPEPRDPRAAARWIAGESERRRRVLALDLVVHDSGNDDEVIGEVGLSGFGRGADGASQAEIGYWVRADRRRTGVARRAVGLVCDWWFDGLGMDRLIAVVDGSNAGSVGVIAGLGFERSVGHGNDAENAEAGVAGATEQRWTRSRMRR